MSTSSIAVVPALGVLNNSATGEDAFISPDELRHRYPCSNRARRTVEKGRTNIKAILDRKDKRLLAVIGPCSIHDVAAAKEYALYLKRAREKYADRMEIIMRVYLEKPRTTIGWKGLINDPHLDGSFDIEAGLCKARELLVWLAEAGIPTGTEALDPISPQYLSDLIAWSAIGARTTESQPHREISSGLLTAVGFKNGTDGSIEVAVNAMLAAANPHNFLGIDSKGQVTALRTPGNAYGHIILRGGNHGPNYDSVNVAKTEQAMRNAGLLSRIVIDCAHANARKDHKRQSVVANNVAGQLIEGNDSIMGIMLESNINAGNQTLMTPETLKYGVSITDACIDWTTTEELLGALYKTLSERCSRTVCSQTIP